MSPVIQAYTPSLVEAVEAPAFDYRQLATLAWRTLRRLGVPEEALPDATQDVLLVVHRRKADFRHEASLSTWVYGIVLRVAANHRRSRRRAFAVFDRSKNAAEIPVGAKTPSPLDHTERRAAVELLERLLSEMPEELRSVFVLVELEELEVSEAASALQINETTCRSWLQRGRKHFTAALARAQLQQSRKEGSWP